MAKAIKTGSTGKAKSFGTRKKGVAKKKRNKHESIKPYNKQGR